MELECWSVWSASQEDGKTGVARRRLCGEWMPENPDITRMRLEYADRARRITESDRYSLFNPSHLFTIQQRQRNLLKSLRRAGFSPLKDRRILELGCGKGSFLLEMLGFGADVSKLFGVELLYDRLKIAHQTLSSLSLLNTDGQDLPFASHSFDLSLQFTVFSSILDDAVKSRLANELIRVTQPQGLIVWYDFWTNPTNRQTKGIRFREIKNLFPNCSFTAEKITLAPPITRSLISFSWILCQLLERFKIFNTHYLVIIKKNYC
jgi:ubiquinone/menaquinone biosynthesis C-methylase UbiE